MSLIPLTCFLLNLLLLLDRGPAPLVLGRTQSDSLAVSGVHAYTIDLTARQFAYGEVDQQGVDVLITVFGPGGGRISTTDVSSRGREPFLFPADTTGTYGIEVAPFERESGRYAITILRVGDAPTTPEGRVDQLMIAHDGPDRPGGVVAVIRGGEVVFSRAYGQANLTHGIPNTPETLFNIGSVSKQFTGIFFAMMAEEGRLSLDDDVRTYLPELPDFGPVVTLRHLLNHTSGFREAYGVLELQGRSVRGDKLRREDAIDAVRRQPALQFPPGSRHLYNSTAYVILTEIAGRVAGEPFPDWMDEHVFAPLGMKSTWIEREAGEVIPGSAFSYTTTATGRYREDFEAYAYYGATDVYTNVFDIARWLGNFRTSTLGGSGVMRRMTERSVLADGDTLGYTLGLFVDRDVIQHGGATGGYRAFLAYYPSRDAGVVVLANTGAVDTRQVGVETAVAFFGESARTENPAPVPVAAGIGVDPALLDANAGAYWIDGTGGFNVTRDGVGLALETPSGQKGPLMAADDSTFWFNDQRSIRFRSAPDGSVSQAAYRIRGEGERLMRRVASLSPAGQNLEGFAGRFFSEEIETFYTIAAVDSALTLEHRRLGTMRLQPVAPDHFLGTWPVSEVAFDRDDTGRVVGFRVTEGRTIGVRFRRVE